MNICKFCKQEKKNNNSLAQHQRLCNLNPERGKTIFSDNDWQKKKATNQYIKAERLGLEKPIVNEETRKKISESSKLQKPKSNEVIEKLSRLAIERNLGGVRQSKWIKYKGKTLGSSYELQVVHDLDLNGIKWDTCKRFNYIDPFGKIRSYTPDIYLEEYDVYLDPKNDFLLNNINPSLGFKDQEKIERVGSQNNIRIIILNKSELSWETIKIKISS
jgi:hypothetical protein